MNTKTWIIFGAICVVVLGGLIAVSRQNKTSVDVSSVDTKVVQAASEQSGNIGDRVFGNAKSPVQLIEYGDFQCPGCGGAYAGLKKISEEYKEQIGFIFRNFPITGIHPNALAAASAAEAAGAQGKYWEMHDAIYENQDNWSKLTSDKRTDQFVAYAKQVGVDEAKFKAELESKEIAKKIAFDQALGGKDKVDTTPTVLLNGERVSSDVVSKLQKGDLSAIRELINTALKQHSITPPTAQ